MESEKKQDQPMRMSVTKSEGGLTTDISVEEIDNGFLITTNKYGDIEGKYTSKTTKTFSKTNPLVEAIDEEDETKELAKGLGGLFNSLAKSEGMLDVN